MNQVYWSKKIYLHKTPNKNTDGYNIEHNLSDKGLDNGQNDNSPEDREKQLEHW